MPSLAGKVAVVTGAGRGIGRAHALALAEAGAKVVVRLRERYADGLAPEGMVAMMARAGGRSLGVA